MQRLRRLRSSSNIRRLVADVSVDPSSFVLPIFVTGDAEEVALESLPGHFYWPASQAGLIAKEAAAVGVPGILVFGVTDRKDERGSFAFDPEGPAQVAISEIKSSTDLVVFSDVCLCGYTSHGHCGVIEDETVDNDATVEVLAKVAVSHAEAGADFVSPSDMMDGRVGAIRAALDQTGHEARGIMSYSAKFASSFYGPFRDVAGCAPQFGDRKSYQIDPSSRRQALASVRRDVSEGADIVMVKPALPYLDVISSARAEFEVPISAYNVSGEFAMIKAASARGWLDEEKATLETLGSILRAGADFVITYHALEAARWLTDAG